MFIEVIIRNGATQVYMYHQSYQEKFREVVNILYIQLLFLIDTCFNLSDQDVQYCSKIETLLMEKSEI